MTNPVTNTNTNTETRVTSWVEFGHYGLTHYRIWTQQDGRHWFQRHEWKSADGSTVLEDWINGLPGHAFGSHPVETAKTEG